MADITAMSVANIKRRDKRSEKIKLNLWCWAFMSLTLIFYLVFQGWPIVCSIYYSVLDWSGLTSNATFVGMQNYIDLMKDDMFWRAFRQSFQYTLLIVPLELIVSLFLAYILNNKRLHGRGIYRTMYFIPVVTTSSIIGIIMIFIWSVQGPVNNLLLSSGLASTAINFLGDGNVAMFTVILISIWKDCGIYMIYWLAGLQSVPEDVYEAATVDGAGRTRTFFSIVLPLIAPTAGIITILCTINSLKVFDIVKTMTEGGPFYATDVIATYVYRVAFSSEMGLPRLGYASAAALTFGAVVIVIGLALNVVKDVLKKKQA